LRLLTISGQAMRALLHVCPAHGAAGGGVYDFIHGMAARQAGVDRIYTLNRRHFVALAPDLAEIIVEP
jgi:hypothetical protein